MSDTTEINLEDYKQLLQFYKNKANEGELSYLLLQLNNKKMLDKNKEEYKTFEKAETQKYLNLIEKERNSHKETIDFLKKEIEKLNKQLEKYKKLNKKT